MYKITIYVTYVIIASVWIDTISHFHVPSLLSREKESHICIIQDPIVSVVLKRKSKEYGLFSGLAQLNTKFRENLSRASCAIKGIRHRDI